MVIKEDLILDVCDILNEYDFAELIKFGCPRDEYYPEAKCILKHIESNPQWNVDDIAESIKEVFMFYFCGEMIYSFPIEECKEIAKKIIKII